MTSIHINIDVGHDSWYSSQSDLSFLSTDYEPSSEFIEKKHKVILPHFMSSPAPLFVSPITSPCLCLFTPSPSSLCLFTPIIPHCLSPCPCYPPFVCPSLPHSPVGLLLLSLLLYVSSLLNPLLFASLLLSPTFCLSFLIPFSSVSVSSHPVSLCLCLFTLSPSLCFLALFPLPVVLPLSILPFWISSSRSHSSMSPLPIPLHVSLHFSTCFFTL